MYAGCFTASLQHNGSSTDSTVMIIIIILTVGVLDRVTVLHSVTLLGTHITSIYQQSSSVM